MVHPSRPFQGKRKPPSQRGEGAKGWVGDGAKRKAVLGLGRSTSVRAIITGLTYAAFPRPVD